MWAAAQDAAVAAAVAAAAAIQTVFFHHFQTSNLKLGKIKKFRRQISSIFRDIAVNSKGGPNRPPSPIRVN
jgi:LDH2 family malate/lactate/ureidoglycolate dehydrogenase